MFTIEGMSRLSNHLSILAVIMIAVCIIGFRLGIVDYRFPVFGFALAAVLAGVALVLAGGSLLAIFFKNSDASKFAPVASMVLSFIVIFPFFGAVQNRHVPPIHDITTDVENPPLFSELMRHRGMGQNSLEIKPEAIKLQQGFYKDIQPLMLTTNIDESFAAAHKAALAMGWQIIRADTEAGEIEATATTRLIGFKDDVVIRLTASDQATRVDMRSVSRVGISDLGTNAARIRAYFALLN